MNHPALRAAPRRLLILAGAVLLAACASQAPRPTLITVPNLAAASPAPSAVAGPVLVVRRVGVPEYLASRRVRFRADASTLAEWPDTWWAERIEVGVSREFTAALRQALPGWTLCEGSCGDRTATYSLQVELQPLDYLRGQARLQASGQAIISTTDAPPRVLRSLALSLDRPVTSDTPQAHAQAISEVVHAMARGLAPVLSELVRTAPAGR